jgi:hypothetical protein
MPFIPYVYSTGSLPRFFLELAQLESASPEITANSEEPGVRSPPLRFGSEAAGFTGFVQVPPPGTFDRRDLRCTIGPKAALSYGVCGSGNPIL